MYKAILKPICTYGIQLWGMASTTNIDMIVDAPWSCQIWLFEGISKYQQLKKKSNASVLNTVPASVYIQMT
jgi:hypothetical protein